MTMIIRSLVLLLGSVAILGCSDTQFEEATGKGVIRGVNGIVDSADAIFLIEERTIGQIPYKASTTQAEFDDLNYKFNFALPIPEQIVPRRIATLSVDIILDTDYTFVLAGPSTTATQIVAWERPVREWDGTETVFEAGFGHVNNTLGEVDVYFAAPGTPPALGNAIGSVAFGEYIVDREFPAGDYELILTAKDDPATVRYSGPTSSLVGANSYTLAAFDSDPSITGTVSVRLIDLNGSSFEFADKRFPPTSQFVHAAFGSGNIDIVVDGDFANPIVSNLAFGEVSDDVDVPSVTASLAYTPTGNTMPLFEADASFRQGSRSMIVVLGEVGNLSAFQLPSERRGFSTAARIQFTNASFNAGTIDVYISAPGIGLDDLFPDISGLQFGQSTGAQALSAQDYEVRVTATGEKAPLFGPVPVTLTTDDVVEFVLLDTADPNTPDLLIFSNLP